MPPPELAAYIATDTTDAVEGYAQQGAVIHEAIVGLLGPDWVWEDKRILDFGCGSGRVIRRFLDVADVAELHGCDIDASCIEWVKSNLAPEVNAVLSGALPPLPYPDEHFDLVYATSVFSHLADSWAAWLLELRRILRPGGVLIASVMGATSSEAIAGEPWDADRIGMNVLGYGRPWAAGGPMVLHSEWWIRAHWGRAFDLVSFTAGAIAGQDAVVLRRPDGAAPTTAELVDPEPGEPRELRAALHCIAQLHREHAVLNAAHDAYAAAYQSESKRVADLERSLDAARAPVSEPLSLLDRLKALRTSRTRL
jgi:SAM-dependent methyltransferase